MLKYMERIGAALVLSTALVASACGDRRDDTLAQDTLLNRDLEMANIDTAAQPALEDVPATAAEPVGAAAPVVRTPARPTPPRATAPRRTTAAPPRTAPTTSTTASGNTVTRTPAGSERPVGTIAAGTTLNLASGSRVCTNTHRVGQRFNATVSQTVTGSNGASIPAGATATVEITELKRSENVNDPVRMGFRVVSVSFGGRTYPLDATTTYANVDRVRNQPQSKDAQKVIGGAAVGAIIGQVLGKDTRSTVIGAATGAAAGAGAAAATANYEGCVPSGGRISISLDAPAQIQA